MRRSSLFLFVLLTLVVTAAPLRAKPKVNVRIHVSDGVGRDHATDSLTKSGATNSANITNQSIFYLNVTVSSEDVAAVAKNHGDWCISRDNSLNINQDYDGTLEGNDLEVQITGNNGKAKKYHFEIFDHKWRKLADL